MGEVNCVVSLRCSSVISLPLLFLVGGLIKTILFFSSHSKRYSTPLLSLPLPYLQRMSFLHYILLAPGLFIKLKNDNHPTDLNIVNCSTCIKMLNHEDCPSGFIHTQVKLCQAR